MRALRARRAARREAKARQPRNPTRTAPLWMRFFSTVSMIGIAAAAAVGAWIGFQAGGLGVGFVGLLGGAGLGYFITYVIGNLLQEMLPLIRVLLVLGVIAATVYVLHLLGVQLGINPQ